jgi:divalent metal cation (Fe/Co/Zn/Cd) transporter
MAGLVGAHTDAGSQTPVRHAQQSLSNESAKEVVVYALAGNALMISLKYVAWVKTGSPVMLSECIHSVCDSGNQALLLYALHQYVKAPDKRWEGEEGGASIAW